MVFAAIINIKEYLNHINYLLGRQVKKIYINSASILIILLIPICIYLVNHFSSKAAEILGVGALAASGSHVVVDIGKGLYLLDGEGGVIVYKTYLELGIPASISKFQLDDQVLYVAEAKEGSLYQCDINTWQCSVVDGFYRVARRAFGFSVQEDKIYIADTARHSFKVFDREGNLLAEDRGEPVPLCYPNQLIVADNRIYIADTNNYRIAEIIITDNYEVEAIEAVKLVKQNDALWKRILESRALPSWCAPISDLSLGKDGNAYFERAFDFGDDAIVESLDAARNKRVWPTSFALDKDNNWWVIAAGDGLRDGDVLIFDRTGQVKRANADEDFDPVAIAEFQGGMLVSDVAAIEIALFSPSGNRLGSFGDSAFKAKLKRLHNDRIGYQASVINVQRTLWFLLVLALIIAFLNKRFVKES